VLKREASKTQQRRLAGISLIETVLSLLIVGGAFVASLNTIASARASQAIAAQQRLGLVLTEDLMEEILTHPYKESSILGLEVGENNNDRKDFDDIDDYHEWSSSPPTDIDGHDLVGAEAYTRSVTVQRVQLSSPTTTTSSDEGVLRIIVTVKYGSKEVAKLTAYRSDIYGTSGVRY